MKKKVKYTVFFGLGDLQLALLSFCFFISYFASAQNYDGAKKLKIDPAAAMGGSVSQYIDSVKFFTFESTFESAFGNIDQVEITDNYYIILDRETRAVLIFTRQGKFHAKLEGKKIHPQDPILYSFNLDKKTNLIEMDYRDTKYSFDLNGKLVNKIIIKDWMRKWWGDKISLGDKHDAYCNYSPAMPFPKDTTGYEIMVSEKDKLIQKYMPYSFNKKDDGDHWQSSLSHSDFYPNPAGNDSTVYYLRNLDYNIYRITPDTLQAAYRFIFPLQNSLPPNFRTDSAFNKKRSQYLEQHKDVIYRLGNFYKKEDCIFFRTINNNFAWLSYLYNTRTRTLISLNKIVSDSTSYFLPITDAEIGGVDFNNNGIINFDGTSFYTSYSSLILYYQAVATKNKKAHYPPQLAAYLSNEKNKKGNPVLVQIHFKPNL